MKTVILLDLNHTFVSNSQATWRPGYPHIERETYRAWLVPLFRAIDAHVILVTVRDERHREATLAKIAQDTGWQPDEAFFKSPAQRYLTAPVYKRQVWQHHILPRHGAGARYLALESNGATRAMYAGVGISAVRVPETPWDKLPAPAQIARLAPSTDDTVVLLDLNFTLVENSAQTFHIVRPNIAEETYRQWLIELLRPVQVALITTRARSLEAATLTRLQRLADWSPTTAHFKPAAERYMPAAAYKRRVLVSEIFPHYGNRRAYLALESNSATRAMYASMGIRCERVADVWDALPTAAPPGPLPGYQLSLGDFDA